MAAMDLTSVLSLVVTSVEGIQFGGSSKKRKREIFFAGKLVKRCSTFLMV